MARQYEPLENERYLITQTNDGEEIRIKAHKQIFPLLFLPVWLAGWSVGGIAAISQLISHFQPFLMFWLFAWALGWVAAAGTIAWMFTGSETLKVVDGDLEVANHALGFSRRWLYQGAMIRHLAAAAQPGWPFRFYWQIPFVSNTRQGAIRFDYGARTYYIAAGLDEAEARLIVDRLAKRLPAGALTQG